MEQKKNHIEGGRRQPGASGPYINLCMGQSPRAKHLAVVFSSRLPPSIDTLCIVY